MKLKNLKRKDFTYPKLPLDEISIRGQIFSVGGTDSGYVLIYGKGDKDPTYISYDEYTIIGLNAKKAYVGDKREKKGKLTKQAKADLKRAEEKKEKARVILVLFTIISLIILLQIYLELNP